MNKQRLEELLNEADVTDDQRELLNNLSDRIVTDDELHYVPIVQVDEEDWRVRAGSAARIISERLNDGY